MPDVREMYVEVAAQIVRENLTSNIIATLRKLHTKSKPVIESLSCERRAIDRERSWNHAYVTRIGKSKLP